MDADTLTMLRGSLRHVLTDDGGSSLDVRLADLGWADVLAEDRGSALRLLFEVKGAELSAADALDPVLVEVLAQRLGTASLSGAVIAFPTSLRADRPSARFATGRLELEAVALRAPALGEPVIARVVGADGTSRLGIVRDSRIEGEPITGVDPSLGLVVLRAVVDGSDVELFESSESDAAWEDAAAAARWLLAAELVGLAEHALATAVQYAGDRFQYGRAIGTFQAVQHRLADAHAAIVGASAVVDEATAMPGDAWVALSAKALAGRAAEEACRQAQQIYGAIGFTWEHQFHRYLRRSYVLDAMLGDWRTLESEIGKQLLDTRRVPRISSLG